MKVGVSDEHCLPPKALETIPGGTERYPSDPHRGKEDICIIVQYEKGRANRHGFALSWAVSIYCKT